jgi:hypothetical protein
MIQSCAFDESGMINNGIEKSSCFDQGRRIQHDLLMMTQPLSTKMSMGKARLTIVMLSSKEEKLHQKLQLCDELDQWTRRGKAAS